MTRACPRPYQANPSWSIEETGNSDPKLDVFIKTWTKLDVVNIDINDTTNGIFHQIKSKAGIPEQQQRLTITGEQLLANRAVANFNTERNSRIELT